MFHFFEEQEYKKSQGRNHRKLASGAESSSTPTPTLPTSTPTNVKDWASITKKVDLAEMSYHPQSNLVCSANNVPTKLPLRPNILSKSADNVPTTSPPIKRTIGFENAETYFVPDDVQPLNRTSIGLSVSSDQLVTPPKIDYEDESSSSSHQNSNNSLENENSFTPEADTIIAFGIQPKIERKEDFPTSSNQASNNSFGSAKFFRPVTRQKANIPTSQNENFTNSYYVSCEEDSDRENGLLKKDTPINSYYVSFKDSNEKNALSESFSESSSEQQNHNTPPLSPTEGIFSFSPDSGSNSNRKEQCAGDSDTAYDDF